MRVIDKLKKLVKDELGITALEEANRELNSRLDSHARFVTNKIADLKEYTRVDADVGFRGNNTIILTGIYRNKAYVRFYDMGDGEFQRLVEQIKDMKDHCLIRNIDQPPGFVGMFDI